MKLLLFLAGILAWIGVGALAIVMAELDTSTLGLFVLIIAVLVAWAVGEYVTARHLEEVGN